MNDGLNLALMSECSLICLKITQFLAPDFINYPNKRKGSRLATLIVFDDFKSLFFNDLNKLY